jgi:hypothetical protein
MAKVKTDLRGAKAKIKRFKKQAKRDLREKLQEEIVANITAGNSPVKGVGRYEKYSDSYRSDIKSGRYREYSKRTRPVNLRLTGDLLKSLFVKVTSKGLKVGFDNRLADIHNRRGAGKSKTIRRMLPTNDGEEFNRSITTRLREVLNRVANKIFR